MWPSGGLSCWQVCGVAFREKEEGLINGAANLDAFADVMSMMDLLGTWTDSAAKSSSARTRAAMWMHFKWTDDEGSGNEAK